MLIMFFGALRVSELFAAAKTDKSLSSLQRKGMLLLESQLVIHLCRSKIDQQGKGKFVVLGQSSITEICPVNAT